jgi:hypothetical protein
MHDRGPRAAESAFGFLIPVACTCHFDTYPARTHFEGVSCDWYHVRVGHKKHGVQIWLAALPRQQVAEVACTQLQQQSTVSAAGV